MLDIYQEEIDLPRQILYAKMVMTGFLRIIFYAFLAYIVYKTIRFYQKLSQSSHPRQKSKQISGLMVKDSVCNTYLPKEDAIKEIVEGKEYFFCSKECRQKFLETKK
jgi:uncharacterized protein